MAKYNSMQDTLDHIRRVQQELLRIAYQLTRRGIDHDQSKLQSPEKELFDEYTPKLKALTYGSNEYKKCLDAMGEALKHHYQVNYHHPEHYERGVNDMSLLDIVEMLVDWKAASERHADGDIFKSIEINAGRFEISDQLKVILLNTAVELWD